MVSCCYGRNQDHLMSLYNTNQSERINNGATSESLVPRDIEIIDKIIKKNTAVNAMKHTCLHDLIRCSMSKCCRQGLTNEESARFTSKVATNGGGPLHTSSQPCTNLV